VIIVLSAVLGYTFHALYPASDTYLLVSVPVRHRASAYALFSGAMMSVQALGSGTVGTAVARGVGYTVAFQSIAAVVGLLTVVLAGCYRAGWLPAGGKPQPTDAGRW
jgi:MFS family permease